MKKLLLVCVISLCSTGVFADTFTKVNGEYSKELSKKQIASYIKRRGTCPAVTVKTTDGKEITGTCEEVLKDLKELIKN